jgi:Domain of unknown function (DUF4331)
VKLGQNTLGSMLAVAALAATAIAYTVLPIRASDHQDSPAVAPGGRTGADISDVFVYPATSAANVVLQMDVDPVETPAQAATRALDPAVLYSFKIAHGTSPTGEDMVIQLQATGAGTTQTINVYGPFTPTSTPSTTSTLGQLSGTIPFNSRAGTTLANGMKVFVGPAADPFFFDLAQFFAFAPDRNFANPTHPAPLTPPLTFNFGAAAVGQFASCSNKAPTDFLAANHLDLQAIVIEAPRSLIAPAGGSQLIHVWATASTTTGS